MWSMCSNHVPKPGLREKPDLYILWKPRKSDFIINTAPVSPLILSITLTLELISSWAFYRYTYLT